MNTTGILYNQKPLSHIRQWEKVVNLIHLYYRQYGGYLL